MGYGYFNIKQVRKTTYTLETKKHLEENLKIAQISDLHMGTAMTLAELEGYCSRIEMEEPDLLALTGDIFDESTTRQEMEAAAAILGGTKTTYGIYYVFGNHDYNYYRSDPNYTPDELRETLRENGIWVLEDGTIEITPEITVAGRSDASVGRKDVSELLEDVDKNAFLLLLDHQPRQFEENKAAGVDLQLSGHTHAGQIWPTGPLGQLFGLVELNYGYQKIGDYQVIVSSGIAGWGYPIRTGGHSEYVMATVKSNNL